MSACSAICLLFAIPLAEEQAKPPKLYLRGTHFIVYSVKAGERVSLKLTPRVVKTDRADLRGYEVIDHASRVIARVPGFEEPTTVSYAARAGGLNALVVKGRRSWYHVDSGERPIMISAGQRRPLHHKGTGRPIYFLVPKGVPRFQFIIICPDKREGATVRIFDPDGKQVFEETDWYHKPRRIKLNAAPKQQGRVWSFRTIPPRLMGKPYGLDDVIVCFDRRIPPFVATDPGWLVRGLLAAGEIAAGQLAGAP